MTPRYREVWDEIRREHLNNIRQLWNTAPGKIVYGTDLPFADRWDLAFPLYEEALQDESALTEVMGGVARRLFKLDQPPK